MDEYKYYNLTAHFCKHPEIEEAGRLQVLDNPRNYSEVVAEVKRIAKDVPYEADVIIGGHPQIVNLLLQVAKILRWKVHFFDAVRKTVYSATILSRMDKYEIEGGLKSGE